MNQRITGNLQSPKSVPGLRQLVHAVAEKQSVRQIQCLSGLVLRGTSCVSRIIML